ncbi:MAG: DUF1501 domain-containing protein [Planctomycetes bacterium]|nr:DUF1501 domain-containing protein [Planctomycetota bacterium]
MLTYLGPPRTCRGRLTRRAVLSAGALGFTGLALPDLLRLRANAAPTTQGTARGKSVVMIWLRGGASHIDSYDMKPDAPAEIRGEFNPIRTNVPGVRVCEHLPLHAKMMDRLAIVRGIKSVDIGDHTPHYILTGFPDRGKRPVFGSVVSYLQPRTDGLPPYASLMYKPPGLYDNEGPTYCGPAHRPFVPKAEGLANLRPMKEVPAERLDDRKTLLRAFDDINRKIDDSGTMSGLDAHTRRAMEMIASPKVRDAFDLKREPEAARERYGKFCESFLMARRLVEAGVAVVTCKVGDWDTHEHNFRDHKEQLPQLDKGFHALVSDLYDRGLEKDVAVVLWGEFGRSPRIDRNRMAGRDHWPEAGAAVVAGGGFKVGQVIGETDAHAARSKGKPYTPSNVLATLYGHLGIDPATTIPDHAKRPMHVLDDREPVRELE